MEEYKDKGLVVIGVPSNNFRQEPGQIKKLKIFVKQLLVLIFLY